MNTRSEASPPVIDEGVVPKPFAEAQHWFFQTLNPEQRRGFLFVWGGIPKDVELSLNMQFTALRAIHARAALEAGCAGLVAENARLRSALERLDRNFDLLLAGKPVRDVAETKAETRTALRGDREQGISNPNPSYAAD